MADSESQQIEEVLRQIAANLNRAESIVGRSQDVGGMSLQNAHTVNQEIQTAMQSFGALRAEFVSIEEQRREALQAAQDDADSERGLLMVTKAREARSKEEEVRLLKFQGDLEGREHRWKEKKQRRREEKDRLQEEDRRLHKLQGELELRERLLEADRRRLEEERAAFDIRTASNPSRAHAPSTIAAAASPSLAFGHAAAQTAPSRADEPVLKRRRQMQSESSDDAESSGQPLLGLSSPLQLGESPSHPMPSANQSTPADAVALRLAELPTIRGFWNEIQFPPGWDEASSLLLIDKFARARHTGKDRLTYNPLPALDWVSKRQVPACLHARMRKQGHNWDEDESGIKDTSKLCRFCKGSAGGPCVDVEEADEAGKTWKLVQRS